VDERDCWIWTTKASQPIFYTKYSFSIRGRFDKPFISGGTEINADGSTSNHSLERNGAKVPASIIYR